MLAALKHDAEESRGEMEKNTASPQVKTLPETEGTEIVLEPKPTDEEERQPSSGATTTEIVATESGLSVERQNMEHNLDNTELREGVTDTEEVVAAESKISVERPKIETQLNTEVHDATGAEVPLPSSKASTPTASGGGGQRQEVPDAIHIPFEDDFTDGVSVLEDKNEVTMRKVSEALKLAAEFRGNLTTSNEKDEVPSSADVVPNASSTPTDDVAALQRQTDANMETVAAALKKASEEREAEKKIIEAAERESDSNKVSSTSNGDDAAAANLQQQTEASMKSVAAALKKASDDREAEKKIIEAGERESEERRMAAEARRMVEDAQVASHRMKGRREGVSDQKPATSSSFVTKSKPAPAAAPAASSGKKEHWLQGNETNIFINAAAARRADKAKRVTEQVAALRAGLRPEVPRRTSVSPEEPNTSSPPLVKKQAQPETPTSRRHNWSEQTLGSTYTAAASTASRRVEEAKKIQVRVAEIRKSLKLGKPAKEHRKAVPPPATEETTDALRNSTWNCQQCTLFNPMSRAECGACGSNKFTNQRQGSEKSREAFHERPSSPGVDRIAQMRQRLQAWKKQKRRVERPRAEHVSVQQMEYKRSTHRGRDPTPSVCSGSEARRLNQIREPSPPRNRSYRNEEEEDRQPRDPSERRDRTFQFDETVVLEVPQRSKEQSVRHHQDTTTSPPPVPVNQCEQGVIILEEREAVEDMKSVRSVFADPPLSVTGFDPPEPTGPGFDPPACQNELGDSYYQDDDNSPYREENHSMVSEEGQENEELQFVTSEDAARSDTSVVQATLANDSLKQIVQPNDEKSDFLLGGLVDFLDSYGVDKMCGVDDETLQRITLENAKEEYYKQQKQRVVADAIVNSPSYTYMHDKAAAQFIDLDV